VKSIESGHWPRADDPPPAGFASGLGGDIRYAWRMIRRAPGFTAIVVLTLALGIGANTALFSVVDGVLLSPLPYPHPEELVTIHASKPNFPLGAISAPNFFDWQSANQTFEAMAVTRQFTYTLTGLGDPDQVRAQFVTADFFRILGVSPIIGRSFATGEDRPGAVPLVLVSEGFWRRQLDARPDVVGRPVVLDGRAFSVVGVIGADFDLRVAAFRPSDVYVPLGQWTNPSLRVRAAALGIHGIGRLKRGVTIEQARADMETVTRNLAVAYPDVNKGLGATLVPMKTSIVGDVEPILLVLLGAVGCVLLIAGVNVANLLLARSLGRSRELAIRAALGARASLIVRQLLTESVLLAVTGGTLGLLVTAWATRLALGAVPAALPRAQTVHVNVRVLVFCLLLSVVTGLLFGLVPALRGRDPDLVNMLKEGGRGVSGTRHALQRGLVVAEMALALVLSVGAGLTIRTLVDLYGVDPGFRPDNVVRFLLKLAPATAASAPDSIRASIDGAHLAIASTPGVRAVSFSWGAFPLSGDDEELFWIEGQPRPANINEMNWTLKYVVEPDYLSVMGIQLKRGRFFNPHDDRRAPPVIVVDELFSAKFFPREDPIGKRIVFSENRQASEIVGIVGHVNQWGLDRDETQPLRAQIYEPFAQLPDDLMSRVAGGVDVIFRAEAVGPGLLTTIRQSIASVNRENVISGGQSLNESIALSLAAKRFSMQLFAVFAVVALALASIGIYGVVSYLVGQRLREIGVRVALGARPPDVLRLVLSHGVRMLAGGVLLGTAGGLVLARVLVRSSMLFGVSGADPLTFGAVALVLVIVGFVACCLPAHRALAADPLVALRAE
jgi:predicted permease